MLSFYYDQHFIQNVSNHKMKTITIPNNEFCTMAHLIFPQFVIKIRHVSPQFATVCHTLPLSPPLNVC